MVWEGAYEMEVYCDMALICSVKSLGLLYPLKKKPKQKKPMNIIVPDTELCSQMRAENWKEGLYSRSVIIIYSGKFQILPPFGKCSLSRKLYTDQKNSRQNLPKLRYMQKN